VSRGGSGGTVWEGQIPNQFAVWDHRVSAIYLPPNYDPARSYPVILAPRRKITASTVVLSLR
jgi:hypothetical protein